MNDDKICVLCTSNFGYFMDELKAFNQNDYNDSVKIIFQGTEKQCYEYQKNVLKLEG